MSMTSRLIRTAALMGGLTVGACATDAHVSQTDPVPAINNQAGLAVKGYDPVAYFTDAKPVKGDPAITEKWRGVAYQFASEEHRKAFKADPGRYAPQYGGFCSIAIAHGNIADTDPTDWAVVNDHLYLNNNDAAQAYWNLDRPGNIQAGNKNWPLVPKLPEKDS